MSYAEWMRFFAGLITWDEANAQFEHLNAQYAELAPESGFLESGEAFNFQRAGEWERAAPLYLKSLEKELTDSGQLNLAGTFALLLGKDDIAVRILEHAVAIDPLCHQCRRILSQALMYRGDPGDYRRAIEVREQYLAAAAGGQPFYSMLLILLGEPEKVAAVWADVEGEDHSQKLSYLAMAEYSMGMIEEAKARLAHLEGLLAQHSERDMNTGIEWEFRYAIGYVAAWFGDADKAFAHLMPPPERVRYLNRLGVHDPVWREVRDDPRWLVYREAIGMSPERLDAIEFDPWLPE